MRELAIAIVVGVITVVWSRMNYGRYPQREYGPTGNITPGKISAAIITLIGVAIALLGVASLFSGVTVTGLICLVVGVALTVFMGLSLTRWHDVNWNSKDVTGPSRLFGPSLGSKRTTIRWDEIESTGKTATDYWFIQVSNGQRIYWSYLYPGYGTFVERLKISRPDLLLPDDLR